MEYSIIKLRSLDKDSFTFYLYALHLFQYTVYFGNTCKPLLASDTENFLRKYSTKRGVIYLLDSCDVLDLLKSEPIEVIRTDECPLLIKAFLLALSHQLSTGTNCHMEVIYKLGENIQRLTPTICNAITDKHTHELDWALLILREPLDDIYMRVFGMNLKEICERVLYENEVSWEYVDLSWRDWPDMMESFSLKGEDWSIELIFNSWGEPIVNFR